MPRLVPRAELLMKTAALQSADFLGRSLAQEEANEELAKLAGLILSGELTPEQWEMLKEAGIFSAMGGWMARKGAPAIASAGRAVGRAGAAAGRGVATAGQAVGRAGAAVGRGAATAGRAIGGAGQKAYSWGR